METPTRRDFFGVTDVMFNRDGTFGKNGGRDPFDPDGQPVNFFSYRAGVVKIWEIGEDHQRAVTIRHLTGVIQWRDDDTFMLTTLETDGRAAESTDAGIVYTRKK